MFAWGVSSDFLSKNTPIPDVPYGNWLLIKQGNYAIILLLKNVIVVGAMRYITFPSLSRSITNSVLILQISNIQLTVHQ